MINGTIIARTSIELRIIRSPASQIALISRAIIWNEDFVNATMTATSSSATCRLVSHQKMQE
jgi:hypothetical protein